jgi:hypothetical protein
MGAFLLHAMLWFGICYIRINSIMNQSYQTCIDACVECAAVCDHCASACLNEENVNKMARCIKLDMECAAICRTAAQLMSLESEHANAICQLCSDICNACAEECSKHSSDHCRICAEICYHCAEECAGMIAA